MRSHLMLALCSCVIVTAAIAVRTTAAPTPSQKCLAKKLKEIGKFDSCRLKAEAKGVLRGQPSDLSNCLDKLSQKWASIEGAGGCDFPGDQAASQALTEVHTDDVVDLLTYGAPVVCGDGVAVGGEACDGADLAGETCVSLGYSGGALACDGSCAFDTSACVIAGCGSGTLDVGEQCDGVDLNGYQCYYLGFSFGVGTLSCDGSCAFDTSSCVELCGNGSRDAASGEECDGADLAGADCSTFGGTGTLGCTANCDYDTSGCSFTCGDGVVNPGEECDSADLNGATCLSNGFTGGTLACDGSCAFDTSGCTATCGDNVVSPGAGEQCDGTDLNDVADCTELAYTSGALSCTGGCLYDLSSCVSDCDLLAQDCAGGDGCYLSIGAPGGCQAPGTAGLYEACTVQADCLPRYYCIPFLGTSSTCVPFCDGSIGDADCPAGFTCLVPGLPSDPDLGVCVPQF